MAEKNVRVKPKSSMSFNKKQWTGAIDTNDVGKRKLFVCNIDYTVQENLLAKHFAAFGQISKCKIMRDATNKSKGLGFVEFVREDDAQRVMLAPADSLTLNKRVMQVREFRLNNNRRAKNTSAIPSTSVGDIDAIHILPIDVIVNIFSRLRLKDQLAVEKVCRRWHDASQLIWASYRHMSISCPTIKPIGTGGYAHIKLSKRGNELKSHKLRNFNTIQLKKVEDITSLIRKCNQITHLSLSDGSLTSNGQAQQFLQVVTENCSNITSLNLIFSMSNKSLAKLVKNCKNVKELALTNCFNINDASMTTMFNHCPNIEALELRNCNLLTDKSFAALEGPKSFRLTSLVIDCCQKITNATLKILGKTLSDCLKILKIRGCYQINSPAICTAMNELVALEELDVSSNDKVQNSVLDAALALGNRPILINCSNTLIDEDVFVEDYPKTSVEVMDNFVRRFKYLNLVFDVSMDRDSDDEYDSSDFFDHHDYDDFDGYGSDMFESDYEYWTKWNDAGYDADDYYYGSD